jgi:hypothetical protein
VAVAEAAIRDALQIYSARFATFCFDLSSRFPGLSPGEFLLRLAKTAIKAHISTSTLAGRLGRSPSLSWAHVQNIFPKFD